MAGSNQVGHLTWGISMAGTIVSASDLHVLAHVPLIITVSGRLGHDPYLLVNRVERLGNFLKVRQWGQHSDMMD